MVPSGLIEYLGIYPGDLFSEAMPFVCFLALSPLLMTGCYVQYFAGGVRLSNPA